MRDARLRPSFAERLKELRQARGWTQDELAAVSGVTQAQISRLEAGVQLDPRASTLERLADAFDMTLDVLVGRSAPAQVGQPRGTLGHHGTVNAELKDEAWPRAVPRRGLASVAV